MGFEPRNLGNLDAFKDIQQPQCCRELGLLRSIFEKISLSVVEAWMEPALRRLGLDVSRWVLLAKKRKDRVGFQVLWLLILLKEKLVNEYPHDREKNTIRRLWQGAPGRWVFPLANDGLFWDGNREMFSMRCIFTNPSYDNFGQRTFPFSHGHSLSVADGGLLNLSGRKRVTFVRVW